MVKHTADREKTQLWWGGGREEGEREREREDEQNGKRTQRCSHTRQLQMLLWRCQMCTKAGPQAMSSFGGKTVFPFPGPVCERLCLDPGAGSACLLSCVPTSPTHIFPGGPSVWSPWLGQPFPQAPGPALGIQALSSLGSPPDPPLRPPYVFSYHLPLGRHSGCARHPRESCPLRCPMPNQTRWAGHFLSRGRCPSPTLGAPVAQGLR